MNSQELLAIAVNAVMERKIDFFRNERYQRYDRLFCCHGNNERQVENNYARAVKEVANEQNIRSKTYGRIQ